MTHEDHSRWLNQMLWGDSEETLCARLWRMRWRRPWYWIAIWIIDHEAQRRFGEPAGHCRSAALNHRIARADPIGLRRLLDEG